MEIIIFSLHICQFLPITFSLLYSVYFVLVYLFLSQTLTYRHPQTHHRINSDDILYPLLLPTLLIHSEKIPARNSTNYNMNVSSYNHQLLTVDHLTFYAHSSAY